MDEYFKEESQYAPGQPQLKKYCLILKRVAIAHLEEKGHIKPALEKKKNRRIKDYSSAVARVSLPVLAQNLAKMFVCSLVL